MARKRVKERKLDYKGKKCRSRLKRQVIGKKGDKNFKKRRIRKAKKKK